ncbi:PQQ-binding-like beta-propeller repeat protein [Pedobacter heparinus]|uniref:outer membrane protein assembly factor BamB family protein n=1 Tax=Pedobacter heparinus TaxID=984 RepID=UPI00292FDF2F|nr:FG-GAP-like repeat-containing protein [Pedobacter heparinus]
MKKTVTQITLAMLLCTLFANGQTPVKQIAINGLPARKPLIRQTILVKNGKANGRIVTPVSVEFLKLAKKLQYAIRQETGAKLEIIAADKMANQRGEFIKSEPDQNIIALGSLENNGVIAHLYFRTYSAVDAMYPGKDGYLIQTVSDPWGKGANVLVLGGSTVKGVEKATDRFCRDLTKGSTLAISGTLKYEHTRKALPNPTDEQIAKILVQSAADFKNGKQGGLFNPIVQAADAYALSGNEGQAKLFRELLFLEYDLKTNSPAAFDSPWGGAADFLFGPLIAAWDKVEESPSFTEEDRVKVLKIILDYIHYYENYAYVPAFKTSIIRHNHHTFPGQGFVAAGQYFGKYYPTYSEAKKWREMGDNCFVIQQQSWKSQEDCSAYGGISARHMGFYATSRPDFTWFDSGRADIAGNLAIMTMDNLGYQCAFGDVAGFNPRSNMALWNYLTMLKRDGRYSWAMHKNHNASSSDPGALPMPVYVKPVEPSDLLGTRYIPMDSLFYTSLNGKGTVPLNQAFDKISFRSSFDPQSSYMVIDGINVGYHGHRDGNSVLRLTDRGRIWLAEGDYIKSSPKFHNTLLIFRDGVASAMPPFVRRELVADLPNVGMTRTTTINYGGTDWTRNVIWDKDKAFVFIDEVKANSNDTYNIQTHWHSLGKPTLSENTFNLSQQGERFSIQNLDGSHLRFFGDVETGKNWIGYKYADPVINTLQQTRGAVLRKGDKLYIINVMSADAEERSPVRAVRVNDAALLLGSGDDQALIGTGGIKLDALETDAQLYWLGNKKIVLGGAKKFSLNGKTIFSSNDFVSVELTADGLTVFAEKPTKASFAFDEKIHMKDLPAGKHVISGLTLPRDFELKFPAAAPAKYKVSGNFSVRKLVEKAQFIPNKSTGNRPTAADKNGIYTAGSDGILYALHADTKIKWQYTVGGDITAVWTGKLTKDTPERIVAGNASGRIVVLDQSGQMIWEQQIPIYKDTQAIVYFTAADLAGDGNRSLIAGGSNWYHYAYNAEGKLLWKYLSLHASSSGTAADLDGDGKQEVIAGTQYAAWHAITPEGNRKWMISPVGPVANAVAAGDLTGSGRISAYIAGGDGNLYAIAGDGKRPWTYNTGDGATCMELLDVNGDGKKEILVGTLNASLIAVNADGTRLWRRDLREPVRSMTLADLDGDGKAEIVVGTEVGHVIALNRDGQPIASWSNTGSVEKLIDVGMGHVAATTSEAKIVVLGMK